MTQCFLSAPCPPRSHAHARAGPLSKCHDGKQHLLKANENGRRFSLLSSIGLLVGPVGHESRGAADVANPLLVASLFEKPPGATLAERVYLRHAAALSASATLAVRLATAAAERLLLLRCRLPREPLADGLAADALVALRGPCIGASRWLLVDLAPRVARRRRGRRGEGRRRGRRRRRRRRRRARGRR